MLFDNPSLQRAYTQAVENCKELTREQADHFVRFGFAKIEGAFSPHHAAEVVEAAWDELATSHHIDRNDPSSWQETNPETGRRVGYVRTRGTDKRYLVRDYAPRAFQAHLDVLGGSHRLRNQGRDLAWGNSAIGNLGIDGDPNWSSPSCRQPGWHKDGWHFRHFMHSPEQGLLIVPIYTRIQPQSGGTVVARDAIAPVARLLHDSPRGLHPDSVQGAGYLIPGLIEQCSDFDELTGEPGDMYVIHPYVLHRVAINPTTRPRFIANMAVVIESPMSFQTTEEHSLSLVELAVLYALKAEEFEFKAERQLKAFKPFPFRDESERTTESIALKKEMQEFAERGKITPSWAADYGYMSNREYLTA